jgi:DNA (cytosine-5)-methyltransferase 1
MHKLTSVELCAGAGGQALGLEQAGFEHLALVEIDAHCCNTLRHNRPQWNVQESDLAHFNGKPFCKVDLLAGGLPCPPFSVAGKQLGENDERNLFPEALRLVREIKPRALMIENVRGILDPTFEDYRSTLAKQLSRLGYRGEWRLFNASDFGVPQLRPRAVFVAFHKDCNATFQWPQLKPHALNTVGDCLFDLIKANGWEGAKDWRTKAHAIAPTIVGGSKKHGGPDLGPTRAKKAWRELSVDGHGVAYEAPARDFVGLPRLTVPMVAKLQGFPDEWVFTGSKTAAYRQVGNAFPPPFARAIGEAIFQALAQRKALAKAA